MQNELYSQQLAGKALSALSNRFFELIMFPTEKCNFHCTYCYEDFKIGKMSRQTINGVKALLLSKFRVIEKLNIDWFGGEPLLALSTVEEVSNWVLELNRLHSHVSYTGSMTTNGYLLSADTFRDLIALGINRYQITLDGYEAVHNATRRMLSGGDGFSRIWRNLLDMRDSNCRMTVMLRVHLHCGNIDSVEELLRNIAREFSGDERFQVLLKRIGNLGRFSDDSPQVMSNEEGRIVIERLRKILPPSLYVVNGKPEVASYGNVCYAAKANSLAIRADGSVAKCTVALYDERNRVGELREDGTILMDRDRLMPWLRGLESLDPVELSCPFIAMPKMPETAAGNLDASVK